MSDKSPSKTEAELADTRPNRRQERLAGGDEHAQLEMLLHRARTARDGEEAMEYVQKAVDILPDDPRVQSTVQLGVFSRLRADAFLAFLAETEKHYVIQFRHSRPFAVPKARGVVEPYPPTVRRTDAERALQMMWWMLLGLVPAGLGAVTLCPVAVWRGLRALQRTTGDGRQRRIAWVAILVALVLGLVGAFFSGLLLLHVLIG